MKYKNNCIYFMTFSSLCTKIRSMAEIQDKVLARMCEHKITVDGKDYTVVRSDIGVTIYHAGSIIFQIGIEFSGKLTGDPSFPPSVNVISDGMHKSFPIVSPDEWSKREKIVDNKICFHFENIPHFDDRMSRLIRLGELEKCEWFIKSANDRNGSLFERIRSFILHDIFIDCIEWRAKVCMMNQYVRIVIFSTINHARVIELPEGAKLPGDALNAIIKFINQDPSHVHSVVKSSISDEEFLLIIGLNNL